MLPPVLLANSLVHRIEYSGSPQSHAGRSNPHKLSESPNFIGTVKADRFICRRQGVDIAVELLLFGVIAIMYLICRRWKPECPCASTIGPLICYKLLSIHLQTTKGKAPQRGWGRTVSCEGGEMRDDNEYQHHLCSCISQKTVTGAPQGP